jgi:hypothetical protein
MARSIAAGALLLGACGFQSVATSGAPGAPEAEDAGINGTSAGPPDDVLYVGSADEYTGTGDLTIDAPITIDTGAMSFGMALPPGVTFAAAKQDGGGSDLAILHVHALAVHADIRAFGARPLVLLSDSLELTKTIDVSAHSVAGPGALAAPAPGGDSGHSLAGGAPGKPTALLISCQVAPPGAGGGALELYARTRISISGIIDAGGGTGGSGLCQGVLATNPGGSGGIIVLQSPVVDNAGRLSANGGGAGGGIGGIGGGGPTVDGQILMYYKTKVAPGVTTPTALIQVY